jgi:hypothetical protein
MDLLVAWAGFAGAWLLVAGPLYQAALELREEDIDREVIQSSKAAIPRPEPPSPWWWLLPPVMYLIQRRRGKAYRDAVLAQLTPQQREQFARYMNKAASWFTVATGATLLAADQTWHLVERYRWPTWVFWAFMVVVLAGCVLNTSVRMISDQRADPAGI